MQLKNALEDPRLEWVEICTEDNIFKNKSEERGQWVLAHIAHQVEWPNKKTIASFGGEEFFLLPPTKEFYSAIAIKCRPIELRNYSAQERILRFLSAMCWYYNDSIHVISWGGSSTGGILDEDHRRLPHNGRNNSCTHWLAWDALHLYNLQNDKDARRALDFYREGLSLECSYPNHLYYPAYSFLSFYKILELYFKDDKKKEKVPWIKTQLEQIAQEKNTEAKKAYDKIFSIALNSSVAEHIYKSGRNAAAHAHDDPSYDPGDLECNNDFFIQLPLIREIARMTIENKFGLKTKKNIKKLFDEKFYQGSDIFLG